MRQNIVALIALSAIVLLLFIQLFHVPFLYDDFDFIFTWNAIHDFNHIPELLSGATPIGHVGVYRPIRGIIYVISYHIFGTNLFFYHIQEIVIYIASLIVIYFITLELTQKKLLSFLTTLFFCILPLHVDNVANLTGNFDTIGALCALFAFFFFQKFQRNNTKIFFLFSLLFSTLAFFTYEITLALPFLLLLAAFFTKKKVPKSIIFSNFVVLGIYFLLRIIVFHIPSRGALLDQFSQKIAGAIQGVWLYIFTTLFPTPPTVPTLASFQGTLLFSNAQEISGIIYHPFFFLSFIATVILLIIGIFFYKRRSLLGFGILWFLISLSSVLPISLLSSTAYQTQLLWPRYAFLASYGLCLTLAVLFYKILVNSHSTALSNYFRVCGIASFIILILYYSALIPLDLINYRDPRPYLLSLIQQQPESSSKYNNLGVIKADYGRFDEALQEFQKAIILDKNNKRAQRNLYKLCSEIIAKEKPEFTKVCANH